MEEVCNKHLQSKNIVYCLLVPATNLRVKTELNIEQTTNREQTLMTFPSTITAMKV